MVLDVADLLGRRPSAVSLKFANLWSTHSRGLRGFRHTGRTAIAVVEEFRGREEELHRQAERIRAQMMAEGRTIRAEVAREGESTPEVSLVGETAVPTVAFSHIRAFIDAPPDRDAALLTEPIRIRRSGTWHDVVVLPLKWVINNPAIASSLAGAVLRDLGDRAKESASFALVRNRETGRLAEAQLHRLIPALHITDVRPSDRIPLLVKLGELKVPTIRLSKSIERRAGSLVPSAERPRVEAFFHIRARELCPTCVALLTSIVDRVQRRP
ncbi:MAG: hypothetical protein L3K11_06270 [Thermoplasmata archaeon]|nr:hypothetical protein [Thermoplasmata archaeon]